MEVKAGFFATEARACSHYPRVQVFVGDHVPPPPWSLAPLLDKFVSWLNSRPALALHPVRLAALAHYKLVHIHPW